MNEKQFRMLFVFWLVFVLLLLTTTLYVVWDMHTLIALEVNRSSAYEECDCNNMTTDMCITICTGDPDPADPAQCCDDEYPDQDEWYFGIGYIYE